MKKEPSLGGGHIRTGAQKRLGVSDSLKTNDMWKKIGYDPYANADETAEDKSKRVKLDPSASKSNAVDMTKALGLTGSHTPGACKICGMVGHLAKDCRNTLRMRGLGMDSGVENRPSMMSPIEPSQSESDDPDSGAELAKEELKRERKKLKKEMKAREKKERKKEKKRRKKEKKSKRKKSSSSSGSDSD